jgi:hypothetical protein
MQKAKEIPEIRREGIERVRFHHSDTMDAFARLT